MHSKRYPKAGLSDFIKLLYQSEFGGGHLIADPADSLKRLETERASAINAGEPLFTDIGDGWSRVSVFAAPDHYSLKTLNGLFVGSANAARGTLPGFLEKIRILLDMLEKGALPFSKEEAEEYLAAYQQAGYPPVSHSPAYRAAYSPAYRVILKRHLWPGVLFRTLEQSLFAGTPFIVAIDGNCGSGKTTLSALLEQLFSANVFHMDDFFLPPDKRTVARLACPGGNVDHERFLAEVLLPLKKGEDVTLRPFSCGENRFLPPRRVAYRPLNIVEGSYSLHPNLRPHYDLKVALRLDPGVQLKRLKAREADVTPFIQKWIPLEELYFKGAGVFSAADLQIDGETLELLPTPSPAGII